MRWPTMKRSTRLIIIAMASLAVLGCIGASIPSSTLIVVIALAAFSIVGVLACTSDPAEDEDNPAWNITENNDESGGPDTDGLDTDPPDTGGYWARCCDDGEITTCYCPAGMACNYGWFEECPDGSCSLMGCPDVGVDAGDTGLDVGDSGTDVGDSGTDVGDTDTDAGMDTGHEYDTGEDGTWQTCCQNGEITTCFCPSDMACNYGWFEECEDGSCVPMTFGTEEGCPDADAG